MSYLNHADKGLRSGFYANFASENFTRIFSVVPEHQEPGQLMLTDIVLLNLKEGHRDRFSRAGLWLIHAHCVPWLIDRSPEKRTMTFCNRHL